MEQEMIVTPEDQLSFTYCDEVLTFKHFVPKESNLIKIRIMSDDEDGGEGIWACISDEDKKKYDDDSNTSDIIICNLRNASLFGPAWGSYVPAKCMGTNRPEFNISKISGKVCYNQVDTES
jgi:hypothetical protein